MSASPLKPTTEERYAKMYARLEQIARADGLQGNDDEAQYGGPVDAFLQERINWDPGTYRLYGAAVRHVLERAVKEAVIPAFKARRRLCSTLNPEKDHLHFSGPEEEAAAVESEREFRKEWAARLQRRAYLAPKARTNRLLMLLQTLERSRSRWGNDTLGWYKAALLTGLSPATWRSVTWVDCGRDRFALCIGESAKPDRIAAFLAVDRLTSDQLAIVRTHLDRVTAQVQTGEFDVWYDACRTLLRTEAANLWPEHQDLPTLDPQRHVFAKLVEDRLTEQEMTAIC